MLSILRSPSHSPVHVAGVAARVVSVPRRGVDRVGRRVRGVAARVGARVRRRRRGRALWLPPHRRPVAVARVVEPRPGLLPPGRHLLSHTTLLAHQHHLDQGLANRNIGDVVIVLNFFLERNNNLHSGENCRHVPFATPCLFVLTDGQRRPSHHITPSFFAFLSHQTLSFFTSVTFSGGGVSRPPSPLCRMYLPWVSVVRGSSRRSLSLMARRSRRKYVGLTAVTHGPSSRTNRPNRPTPPPPPRLFPASHAAAAAATVAEHLPSPLLIRPESESAQRCPIYPAIHRRCRRLMGLTRKSVMSLA